jgi:hypothetical protein
MRYWKQLQGPQAAAVSAEQMAMVLAMFPMVSKAMDRMAKDGDKLAGTPLETTMTFEAIKSADQVTREQSAQQQERRRRRARRPACEEDDQEGRAEAALDDLHDPARDPRGGDQRRAGRPRHPGGLQREEVDRDRSIVNEAPAMGASLFTAVVARQRGEDLRLFVA